MGVVWLQAQGVFVILGGRSDPPLFLQNEGQVVMCHGVPRLDFQRCEKMAGGLIQPACLVADQAEQVQGVETVGLYPQNLPAQGLRWPEMALTKVRLAGFQPTRDGSPDRR